ncbi:MAG: hypothetical protein KKF30_12965 [Proteobacteria bacterium]|nr:hypothetical protein [Pseudomonadota bacterium]MBU4470653.1 hypothetical protein [Pseudomonadota bacterium]MCG2751252.1 hypothetical protein [Desulfobacteraceae bacterium]
MTAAVKNRGRTGIALLLLLCLLPAVTKTELSVGLQDTGDSQRAVLFVRSFGDCEGSVFAFESRTHYSSFDRLFKDAIILGQIPQSFTRESSLFIEESNPSFTHPENCSKRPRAPPYPQT